MYTSTYCVANPNRSKEVWQYIDDINTASSSFLWENVYNYDITFRDLMEFNPQRSLVVTYNKMWNLGMKDSSSNKPSFSRGGRNNNSFNFNRNPSMGSNNNNNTSNSTTPVSNALRRKPDYCWSFNKGIKCKFCDKCRFIKKCSYCNANNHGLVSCPKLDKKLPVQKVENTNK